MRDSEQICQQMARVRRDLNQEVGTVVQNAKRMADWRSFVSRHPMLTVSAAAAIGFLVVPKRLNVKSPNAETLEELARKNKLVVKPKADVRRQAATISPLISLVAGAVTRSALAMAGQHVSRLMTSTPSQPAGSENSPDA